MKFNKKEKILFFATVACAALFLMDRIFFSGFRQKAQELRSQIKTEELKLKKYLEVEKDKERILRDSRAYEQYIKDAPAQERKIASQLIQEIEHLAKDASVTITNLSSQETPDQASNYKRFKADLRFEARVGQALDFLSRIQESRLLVKIDKITLSPKDELASLLKGEAVVSVAVF